VSAAQGPSENFTRCLSPICRGNLETDCHIWPLFWEVQDHHLNIMFETTSYGQDFDIGQVFWVLVCSGAMATGPSKHTVSNKVPSGFLHGGRSSSKGTCRLGFRHQEPLRAILVSRFASTLISKPVYTAVNTKIAVYHGLSSSPVQFRKCPSRHVFRSIKSLSGWFISTICETTKNTREVLKTVTAIPGLDYVDL
jgi:hypothetical protein